MPAPVPQQGAASASRKINFLATMSHELRTPINAIVGYAELLLSPQVEGGPAVARRDYAVHILDSARQLQVLVDDVLDATRVQNGTLSLSEQDHDFAELVEVVVRGLRDSAEVAGVSIIADLTPGIAVDGDPQRLRQVIRNLLSNAIKFTPRGGQVSVDMQRCADGRLVLAVSDTGIGLAPDDVERIFEPFVQAENGAARRFGGVGLGLTIARHIARLHGGDITLRSEQGKGTQVRLLLPAARVHWPMSEKRAAVA